MSRSLMALAAALLVLMVVATVGGDHGSSLWPFAGRFHPLLVHLPIGILVLAIGAEVTGRVMTRSGRLPGESFGNAALQLVPPALLVGAWSAVLAGLAGVLLSDWGSYDPQVLQWHRWIGLAIPVLATLTWWLRRGAVHSLRVPYVVAATGLAALVAIGGHLGGTLSRGEGYLTRFLPVGARQAAGLPDDKSLTRLTVGNPDTTKVFGAIIQPILTTRCGSCHNPDRNKGGLVLTSAEGIAAGGRQGKAIVPGRADDSEIVIRLSLPPGHADAMPPDRPIPASELALLRWWIEEGAAPDVTLGDIERPTSIRRTLAAYGLDDLPTGIFALATATADPAAARAARSAGLDVQRLSANTQYLMVDATNVLPGWDVAQLELLRPLAPLIAWVNLSRTSANDSSLLLLAEMSRLTRLRLSGTRVSDVGLERLRRLPYLEYLNLVDTDVSDAGLRALEGMSRLRAIYLWGTRVTDGGVARLQRALPRATIRLGASPLVDPTAIAARDSAKARGR